jgi:hypothetical protein
MMTATRLVRSSGKALSAATLAALLLALPAFETEAQVRRGGGGGARTAAAPRAQAAPAQRPAAGAARTSGQAGAPGSGNVRGGNRAAPVGSGNVQGGNRAASVGSGNVQGGNRMVANSNVNIGNDINVVRPPAYRPPAGACPPAYRPPVAVPVYPGYNTGPSTGEIVAAGVVAGATAGLISGAMQQPSTTAAPWSSPRDAVGDPPGFVRAWSRNSRKLCHGESARTTRPMSRPASWITQVKSVRGSSPPATARTAACGTR